MDRRRALIAAGLGVVALVGVALLFMFRGPTPQPTPTPSPTAAVTASPTGTGPTAAHSHDGAIDKTGLRHDSRDTLYRTPGGAVPAGTPVLLRFRTFHDDATAVTARVYSVNAGDDEQLTMDLAAADVSCYDPALAADTCDFWQTALANGDSDNLWYRFIVEDGSAKVYYADDTPALDGGEGAPSDIVIDLGFALTVYEPDFTVPAWTSSAVVYQIFPDRFRNGDPSNDPQTGDVRYDDPVVAKEWTDLPEGYCRGYSDGNCDQDPHGRDYFGGDLAGITEELGYLSDLGVTAIYLNPIFDSASNHGYDTQDYTRIDPYFGTPADWNNLVEQADALGIRIILDGVFNHVSSDSPFFDRYGHFDTVGGCEAEDSEFRDWFYLRPQLDGVCTGPDGPGTVGYVGWSGYDSIPVIQKGLDIVRQYFLTGYDVPVVGFRGSVARTWLHGGASGWRLDVSGDPTFPDDWWPTFRQVVKGQDPDALTVAEQWQKDTTLLRQLRGDRFDTTMNYRFRDAVLGFLAPGQFDRKGFPASGAPTDPADFAARMLSQQEDYAPAVYRSLLNLLDSHDTERIRWTLTPGEETQAARELDNANVAEGLRRTQLAELIQFTMPGAPMVYYGDEIAMTGDDDPDDRRPHPWPVTRAPEGYFIADLRTVIGLRAADAALTDGDLRFLLVGTDDEGTIAYGRKTSSRAAVVAINRSDHERTVAIPIAGFVPDGTKFTITFGIGLPAPRAVSARNGVLTLDMPPLSGALIETGETDLVAPAAPAGLQVRLEPGAEAALTWSASAGAAGYNVYASPLTGGGFVRLNDTPVTDTNYFVALTHHGAVYFVVTALDASGNESAWSTEALRVPVD